jgi:hypothetical protein
MRADDQYLDEVVPRNLKQKAKQHEQDEVQQDPSLAEASIRIGRKLG